MDEPAFEPADAVIAYAAASGRPVTREQLARWHRAGIIPRPETRHRVGERGTESLYPPGTALQVVAASQIHEGERRLGHVAFRLWWDGYVVEASVVRDFARKVAADLDTESESLAAVVDSSGELTGEGRDAVADVRYAPPAIRRVQRRTTKRGSDPGAFAEVVAAMARIALHEDAQATPEDLARIDHGLGLDEGDNLPIAGGRPLFDRPPGDGLEVLQGVFAPGRFTEVLEGASDADLARSRDNARTMVTSLVSFTGVLRTIDPPWAAGLGLLGEALGGWTESAEGLCSILLLVLMLSEHAEIRQGIDELRAPMQAWSSEGLRSWQQLDLLRSEVPEIRRILTPARLRRAVRSQTEYERLQEDLRKAHTRYGDKIDAVVSAHPEVFTPDDAPPDST